MSKKEVKLKPRADSLSDMLLKMREGEVENSFGGYIAEANTTAIPNEFLDFLMVILDEDELRYMLFAMRHTIGYDNKAGGDFLSESQFITGVRGQDVGSGIGLGENYETRRSRVRRASQRLQKKGFITLIKEMRIKPDDRYPTTFVRVNKKKIKSEFEAMKVKLFDEQSEQV